MNSKRVQIAVSILIWIVSPIQAYIMWKEA
jgi:hypothetical protein